jgi:hypothetical protein
MKYLLLTIGLMIGSSLLLGTLAHNFVEEARKTNLEKYCEQLKTWHPDCKVE